MGFRRRRDRGTRLFFATDIHGSEQCFRKWLNAAAVFEADALILGGDITGKSLIPLVQDNGGWHGEVFGQPVQIDSAEELDEVQRLVRMRGAYDVLLSPAEKTAL